MTDRYIRRYNRYIERAVLQARISVLDKEIRLDEIHSRFFDAEDFEAFIKMQTLTTKMDEDDDDDAQG